MPPAEPDIERIEEALEEGRAEEAMRLVRAALKRDPDSADLHALAGWSLEQLDDFRGAAQAFERALELEPDEPDWLIGLGEARWALLDFDGAEALARRASELEERADAFDLLSRLAERRGDLVGAERHLRRARDLDRENFPLPYRLSEKEFRKCAEEALSRLPERFRAAMRDELTLLVEPIPPVEILAETDPPLEPGLLGLYTGIPLPEREPSRLSGALPDRIYLFQRNIEREAGDREALIEEIAITLYHEVGHFLGLDEDDLEDLDFA